MPRQRFYPMEDVRKALEKRLRRLIPDAVWETLAEGGHIEVAEQEEACQRGAGLEYLIDKAREYLRLARKLGRKPSLPEADEPHSGSREAPPDKRLWALTRIMAVLANRDEEVQRFREEVLGGRLLSPEEVPKWIEEQAKKEGHTITVSFNVSIEKNQEVEEFERQAVEHAKHALESGQYGMKLTLLSYLAPPSTWQKHIPIRKDGVLGRLKQLAKKFDGFWGEAQAVWLILTGEALPIPSAKTSLTFRTRGVPRITLEVSPHLKPEAVAALYAQARRGDFLDFPPASKKTRRPLTEKHLTLAVFAVEEEGSWQELLNRWNEKYPQWQYKEKRTFARDAKAAYRRVTGWWWG